MIRDQFKDVKKVTTKEARKKATMGEKNYYAKQISKLQDLNKSLGVSMIITTVFLSLAFAFVLLLFIASRGTKEEFELWRFIAWTIAFGVSLIFTLVWYIFIKPANLKKIETYRHELERINALSISKAKGMYALYGEEFKRQQQLKHEQEKAKAIKIAEEKKVEDERTKAEQKEKLKAESVTELKNGENVADKIIK